jgi:hypothetical protein
MNIPIKAAPFIAIAPRGHRQRIGKEPRVLLASTTVDVSTKAQLKVWQSTSNKNLGAVLDSCVSFAKQKGFARSLPKNNAGAPSSTSATPASTA